MKPMARCGPRILVIHALLSLLLGGCAGAELFSYTAKKISGTTSPVDTLGTYKIGDPYQIEGVWYYPTADPNYDETGIASWYGESFHGQRTANGAVYDMNALTGAHRTLPMPSRVRVTNLENGRSIVIVINDRGPYARGRIIDVSRRAAQLLGFYKKGTALVRVQAAGGEPQKLLIAGAGGDPEAPTLPAAPSGEVEREPLAEVAAAEPLAPEAGATTTAAPAAAPIMYIQAGAFSNPDNARRLSAELARFGDVRTTVVMVDGREVHRVRLGPIATPADAAALLERIIAAGHADAHLVVD